MSSIYYGQIARQLIPIQPLLPPVGNIFYLDYMYGGCPNAPPLPAFQEQAVPCPYLSISRCPICNEHLRPSNSREQYCEPCRSNGLHQWNMHMWQGDYTAIFSYGDRNSVEKCSVWVQYFKGKVEINHHFKNGIDWNGNEQEYWLANRSIDAFDFRPNDYPDLIHKIRNMHSRAQHCGICSKPMQYRKCSKVDDHSFENSMDNDSIRYEYTRHYKSNNKRYGAMVSPTDNKMMVYSDTLIATDVPIDSIVFDPKHPDELIDKIELLETFS